MQALKTLAILILGVSLVGGEYWWMDTTDAFGDDIDSQDKRVPRGGYGGGGSRKKSQTVGGYPHNTGIIENNNSSPPPTNPQIVNNPATAKLQDYSDAVCPTGLYCISVGECKQSWAAPELQGVVTNNNYIPCNQNKICCPIPPVYNDALDISGSSPSASSILEPVLLPETQCSEGWKCVRDLFCDATSTMVQFRVELTQEERNRRGELTPCMNQATQQFDVCCRKPVVENNQIDKLQRQEIKQTTCPVINILPPISLCQGRPSNCWSVGVADTDCVGDALCCFDGCANVCQGEGPIKGNPGPQTNARGQQKQQTLSSKNNNQNSNKPEDFQQLSLPTFQQELGASSPAFQTIKQSNPTGYGGQPLPTQNSPVVQSFQNQPAINKITTTRPTIPIQRQPLINTIQKQPITNAVQNIYNEEKIQYAPEDGSGYGNSQYYPTTLNLNNQNQPLLPNNQNEPLHLNNQNQPLLPNTQYQTSSPSHPNTQIIIFPEDSKNARFPTFPQTSNPLFSNISPTNLESAQDQFTPDPQPDPVQVIQPSPVPDQQPAQLAASQPWVTCPSAMKCVQRINCNLIGVMVEEEVFFTQEQELQRVPLIPCFNPARSNAVDVCCRDPNYKDPWTNNGNGNNEQFNTVQHREVQGPGFFQEASDADVQVDDVPRKRKTNAYGK